MILLEKTQIYGWEEAIRGMRNPMNSWDKSDTRYGCETEKDCDSCGPKEACNSYKTTLLIGPNDYDLMSRLAMSGKPHSKYRRMIVVYVDITAPLYWWKEFDTYKVGTVANSCSTMHKIGSKEFVREDFSCEHLVEGSLTGLDAVISFLNTVREGYLEEKDPEKKKQWWWQMIQMLPSSYNQKRTVMLNYEVLNAIYYYRKYHKQDEWRKFCAWIEQLPYSDLITCNGNEKDNKDKTAQFMASIKRINDEEGENGKYYLELPDGYRLIYNNDGYVGRYNPSDSQ